MEEGFGHSHFLERAQPSRRAFLAGVGGGAATMSASSLWLPRLVSAADPRPSPIPGGFAPGVHVYGPNDVDDIAVITDFDGVVMGAHHIGTGTGTQNGVQVPMTFDTDMRFMDGIYVGVDGQTRRGTFGFV